MFLAVSLEFWAHPHYSAPAAAALYGVMAQILRRMNAWGKWGCVATQTLVAAAIAVFLVTFEVRNLEEPVIDRFGAERARVERQLEKAAPQTLVIVRYPATHYTAHEWVYNRADIDHAPVVWARDVPLAGRRHVDAGG